MCCHYWLLCFFALTLPISLSSANQMDPHVFPSKGPFFEGWYMRIMDQQAGTSVGWLFSHILVDKSHFHDSADPCIRPSESSAPMRCPENLGERTNIHSSSESQRAISDTSSIPYFVNAIILINPNNKSKLSTNIKYFPLKDYSITENGHPIIKNPDDRTPPHFEVRIGNNVSFIVRPNGTKFSLQLGDTVIKGETDDPVPWGPHGEGPESWIDKLPLSLHWFVYSLRSNVLYYEVINKPLGLMIRGGSKPGKPVFAHIEKNWGASFPKAWIWAQGVDAYSNASFAVSAGLITELGIDVPAQLSNYRNPQKGIDCKFHPVNSVHVLDHDGCSGKAYLHVTGIFCEVVFEMYTRPEFLSDCLTTPQAYGYSLGCVESYNAMANVTVYQRKGIHMVYTDSHVFSMAALEFGGNFMCNGKCP